MGWFKRFMARRDNIPSTAEWACLQYSGWRKKLPDVSDDELIERIIVFRYAVSLSIAPDKWRQLKLRVPEIEDLADLAFEVLAAENDDNTATSPFQDIEWVEETLETIRKVVTRNGLDHVRFRHDPNYRPIL